VAVRLGYLPEHRAVATGPAVASPTIEFVLPGGTNTFLKLLSEHLATIAETRRSEAQIRVHHIEGFNPEALARTLLDLRHGANAIGVLPLDHPVVREAIREVVAGGVPVLTVVSDISNVPRLGYVGIDNRAAGRLAGHLLGRFMQARGREVALFAGSLSYRGHEEREMGFRHILRDEFPELQIVGTHETFDDRIRALDETRALLAAHPDIAAIYNVGAGLWGIGEALKERSLGHKVVLVGHEATEANKLLLLDGTLDAVIDQNPRVEAREALNLLSATIAGRPYQFISPRIQVVFKENIPDE
jgi:LacI family transcriptional regulator